MKKIKDYGWLLVLVFLVVVFVVKPLYISYAQPEEKKPKKVTLVNLRVVDIERIINEYSGARTVANELQMFIASEEAQCQKFKEEVLNIQKYLKQNEDNMTVEEQNKYLRAIEVRKGQYEDCIREKDRNILNKEASLKTPVLGRIYEAIESVSMKNGYNMVMDSKSVLFFTKELNITDEVLEELQ
ncbi:MAG: OmpH family outer membrane protein [bacterium]|nr:OmpH family outer membrane protein [bacterium]